ARRRLGWTALGAGLVLYPFADRLLGLQTIHAVSDGMIYVLLALGLNIVVGYAGLLDLGYAAFFAIGAYAMGLLNSPVLGSPLYGHRWSFWLCIWIAAAVSALLGLVIGAPTLRVRGDYLAIITLGFGEIILLCMVVLGGAGSLKGVILGGMLITIFDRVVLSQSTFLVRWIGRTIGVPALAAIDLTLWRWFFFGLGLVLVMLLRPQGLAG